MFAAYASQYWSAYEACIARVKNDKTGEAHCSGQYLDFWKCIDKCVSFISLLGKSDRLESTISFILLNLLGVLTQAIFRVCCVLLFSTGCSEVICYPEMILVHYLHCPWIACSTAEIAFDCNLHTISVQRYRENKCLCVVNVLALTAFRIGRGKQMNLIYSKGSDLCLRFMCS